MTDEHAPSTEVFKQGDRVAVSDDEPVHVAINGALEPERTALLNAGSKATVLLVNDRSYAQCYLRVVFDDVPNEHTVPSYRFRKLDPIEWLSELA